MSDVERLIEQWRSNLAGSEALSPADIKELESHLRQEVDHLKSLGLSNEEAFWVARHRLGDRAVLEGEFAKLRPHQGLIRRLCWAMMGVLLYVAATEFAGTAYYLFLKLGYVAGLRQTALGLFGGTANVVGFTAPLLVALWLYTRHGRRRTDGPVRHAKAAPMLAAALVAGIWVFFVVSHLLAVLFTRTVGSKDFAAAMPAAALVCVIRYLGVPTLLAGLLVVLYVRGRREVQAV